MRAVPNLDGYVKKAKSLGISRAKIIDIRNVALGNWVRLKCQFGCGGYGQCLTCPPYSPTPEFMRKMFEEYSRGLLMQIEDISPRDEARVFSKFKRIVAALEREIFLDGYYKAFGLTAGPCPFCRSCNLTKPCKYPHRARPSMEACGIDVYQTAKNSGLTLEVVRSREFPCSYLSLILIE